MLRLSSSSQWTSVWITSNDKAIMVRAMLGRGVACLHFTGELEKLAWEHSSSELVLKKNFKVEGFELKVLLKNLTAINWSLRFENHTSSRRLKLSNFRLELDQEAFQWQPQTKPFFAFKLVSLADFTSAIIDRNSELRHPHEDFYWNILSSRQRSEAKVKWEEEETFTKWKSLQSHTSKAQHSTQHVMMISESKSLWKHSKKRVHKFSQAPFFSFHTNIEGLCWFLPCQSHPNMW